MYCSDSLSTSLPSEYFPICHFFHQQQFIKLQNQNKYRQRERISEPFIHILLYLHSTKHKQKKRINYLKQDETITYPANIEMFPTWTSRM